MSDELTAPPNSYPLAASVPGAALQLDANAALIAALEIISDAVFSLDRQWQFVYVNASGEAMLRRSRAELLGATVWSAFPETVGTIIEEQYRRVMVTREATSFERMHAEAALRDSEAELTEAQRIA